MFFTMLFYSHSVTCDVRSESARISLGDSGVWSSQKLCAICAVGHLCNLVRFKVYKKKLFKKFQKIFILKNKK